MLRFRRREKRCHQREEEATQTEMEEEGSEGIRGSSGWSERTTTEGKKKTSRNNGEGESERGTEIESERGIEIEVNKTMRRYIG